MKEAVIRCSFQVIEWFGSTYLHYEEDAEENTFRVGDKVLILHEVTPNQNGRVFVIYNERINNATVVSEVFLKFSDELINNAH